MLAAVVMLVSGSWSDRLGERTRPKVLEKQPLIKARPMDFIDKEAVGIQKAAVEYRKLGRISRDRSHEAVGDMVVRLHRYA